MTTTKGATVPIFCLKCDRDVTQAYHAAPVKTKFACPKPCGSTEFLERATRQEFTMQDRKLLKRFRIKAD